MLYKRMGTPINRVMHDFEHQGIDGFLGFDDIPYPLVLRQSRHRLMVWALTALITSIFASILFGFMAVGLFDMHLWGIAFFVLLLLTTLFPISVKNLFHTLYIYHDHLIWQTGFIFKKTHRITFDDIYNIHVNGIFIYVPSLLSRIGRYVYFDTLHISYTCFDDNNPKQCPCHVLSMPLYRSNKQKEQVELKNIVTWLALYKKFLEYKQSKNNSSEYTDTTDKDILHHLYLNLSSGNLKSRNDTDTAHSFLVKNLAARPFIEYPITFYLTRHKLRIYFVIGIIIAFMLMLAVIFYNIPNSLKLWLCIPLLLLYYFSIKLINHVYCSLKKISCLNVSCDAIEVINGYPTKKSKKLATKDYNFYLRQIQKQDYYTRNYHINPRYLYKINYLKK